MKRKLWLASALAALIVTGATLRIYAKPQENLDGLKLSPEYQKLVFENAILRVTEERLPPGRTMPKHQHPHGVTIAMSDYQSEQKVYPAGQMLRATRHFGEVNWTDGIIHESHNVGTTEQYVVRIELK